LQKSFLDPQHVISSLNSRGKKGIPHRLAASESFHAPLFHAGPESDITNFKKNQKKAKPLRGVILCDLKVEKNQTLRKTIYQKVPSHKWPITFEVA
jgi:hypothetical protein